MALSLVQFLSFEMLLDSIMVYLHETESYKWDYEVGLDGFSPMNLTQDWEYEIKEIKDIYHGISDDSGYDYWL